MTGTGQATPGGYTIEQLSPQHFDVLLPIMKDAFGMTVDVEYFRWKFLDNPAGQFLGFVARAADGEIGAYYGVIPERYSIDGVATTIYQSCDTMTHSRHRRRGLFQTLALHCYQHLRDRGELFVIGFGGGQSTPGFLKFGWRHIFDVRPFVLPRALCWLKTLRPHPGGIKVRATDSSAEILELFARSNSGSRVHLIKDAAVLRWRLANPRKEHRVLVCDTPEGVAGYAILNVEADKIALFDFFASSRAAERALMREICERVMRQPGCKGVATIGQEHTAYADAIRRGWFFTNRTPYGPAREVIPFIIYAPNEVMDQLGAAASWNITPVDHDAT